MIFYIEGAIRWAKVRQPVPTYDEKGEEWAVDIVPTAKGWEEYRKSGGQLKSREADDGAKYLTVRRKTQQMNYAKGELEANEPPKVFIWDDQAAKYVADNDVKVGNGSEGVISVDVYPTKNGKAVRLERVFVKKLVKYEGRQAGPTPDTADLPF